MSRILLLTNDFPPRRGGIQSYLEQYANRIAAAGEHQLVVYAPQWKGADAYDSAAPFPVVRHPGTLMIPEIGVDRRMRRLIREHDVETVWFGAAAPLALLGPRARDAGARRILACTHGHEVGWSMLPGARAALRRRAKEISGDLDNIALKALSKRPEHRYPSVEAMALDLHRYLEGKPVLARPQSMAYRTHKFVHRHRWALATSSASR